MILGYNEEDLKKQEGIFTAEEIAQQPETWRETEEIIRSSREKIDVFISEVTGKGDYDIILTGAGSSEFTGTALYPALLRRHRGHVHAIATTDLVDSPDVYITPGKPALLVSFARSGSSPESVGAVNVVDEVSDSIKHLFITCNKDGELAKLASKKDNALSILLPERTHDRSFVMTSSFTNMYIAAFLCLSGDNEFSFNAAVEAAAGFIKEGYKKLEMLDNIEGIKRVVCLGSDVLRGIARESALKMMEITGGEKIAIWDTPMGFRHGPKSIVDSNTLTILYLSGNPYTRRYEMDFLSELDRDRKGSRIIAVSPVYDGAVERLADITIVLPFEKDAENDLIAPAFVTVGQTTALRLSMETGHHPDNPCPSGEVNRVVKGVTIYPYK